MAAAGNQPGGNARGLLIEAAWWAGAFALAACLFGLASGAAAAVAVATGALLAGGSLMSLARGLEILVVGRETASRASRRAIVAFVLRHGALAALLWAAVALGLPAGWLIAGVTAWPAALVVAGLRRGAAAPAAG